MFKSLALPRGAIILLRTLAEFTAFGFTALFLGSDLLGLQQIALINPILGNQQWLQPLSFAAFVVFVYWRVVRLERENAYLKDRRISLEICFERQFPMWWPEECWYRVEVRNQSALVSAERVIVRLESIEPANPLPVNVLPSQLGRKIEHEQWQSLCESLGIEP